MNMKANFTCRPNNGAPVLLVCPLFERFKGSIRHGFSTRLGGVSQAPYASLNLGMSTQDKRENLKENYSRFCCEAGVEMDRLVLSHQVHGSEIKIITSQDVGKGLSAESDLGEFDGMITAERGIPLAVFYADCTPILLFDPKQKVIAAVHSGWKGTLARIGRKAVQMMRKNFGCDPADILASFGPSIKQCHFEVEGNVFVQFCENFGTRNLKNTVVSGDKFFVDTDDLNRQQLLEEGLKEENIAVCDACTFCQHNVFYSHRADGGITGRMCAVIELI